MRDFNYKKKFGQNFLTDTRLLEKIVELSGVTSEDTVVEIGAGKGALTEVLSKFAKRVISFEIDPELTEYLSQKFDNTNVQLVFDDVMNYTSKQIENLVGEKFKLVANLPYYVTSPLLTKFLSIRSLASATVMVQEEVADRIIAEPRCKDYGVLTILCQMYGSPSKVLRVGPEKFTPQPNVDSAVVHIEKHKEVDKDYSKFFAFVKSAFAMRRKKLSSNLQAAGYDKLKVESWLKANNKSELARAEELSIPELLGLFDELNSK